MSYGLAVGLTILLASSEAAAERSVIVDVAGAPFAAAELVDAMRVRIAAEGPAIGIRVSPIEGGVRIEAGRGVREVALGQLTGTAAARMVALAASDLLLDDLAMAPALAERSAPVRDRRTSTIGVLGTASGWDGALGTVALDASAARGPWIVAFEAGGGTLVDGRVDLLAAVVRFGGGYRAGAFELRAGGTLAPIVTTDGVGDRTLIAGGNASARLRVPLSSSLRAVLAVGLDAFATRTVYVVDGMTAMATPRFAPWLALGFEVMP